MGKECLDVRRASAAVLRLVLVCAVDSIQCKKRLSITHSRNLRWRLSFLCCYNAEFSLFHLYSGLAALFQ